MTSHTRFELVIACVFALAGTAACRSHPDIRGENAEAQEWAEQEKKEEAARKSGSQLPPYRPAPPAAPKPAPTPPPAQ